MLPRLCIVGLIAILGEERWLDEVDSSALDPVCLILPITERRKLVSEFVPNLDRVVPTGEWLWLLEFVVRRRTGSAGDGEYEFSLSDGADKGECGCDPGGAR